MHSVKQYISVNLTLQGFKPLNTLIFLFLTVVSVAQINPPSLRCAEVMNNGDVKLSWVAPADPGDFYAYEVYQSTLKNGTYTLIPSTLTAISTTNFVHVNAHDTIQSFYYYMLSRSGSGGANISIHSDTLRTIFLTSFANTTFGTLDLTYNAIHNPKLPSTSKNYSVLKEYPMGTWNVISSTDKTVYPDTIWVCEAKINYRITLADEIGCNSVSNILRGNYTNSKDPDQPYVDSISVLPNGNTIIAWQVPSDKDINQYQIQYRTTANKNDSIDTVYGRDQTSYTYSTTTANSNTVGIYVKAIDSCGRTSTVYYEISTLFLRTSYNQCAFQTTLNWNPYQWAKIKGNAVETTQEYRIYYSVEGSTFTQIDATKDTFYVHKNVPPGKNVCYFIRVINTRATITASSNRHCFFTTQVKAPTVVYIRSASVLDSKTVQLKIYVDTTKASTGITLQRSENDSVFNTIAFIPSTGTSDYTYLDKSVNTQIKSYTYRTLVVDSCGNERNGSNPCKTILLKIHEDKDLLFSKRLSWNEYEGFAGSVSGYAIYRTVNENGQTELLGYTDSQTTTFTDDIEGASDQGAGVDYFVQAFEGLGNPYGFSETSLSNSATVYMEGNLYIPNAFAPSGMNAVWKPVCYFVDLNDYQVLIYDRWGKKIFETRDQNQGWTGTGYPSGVYMYLINYKNARGEYLQSKGTVTLIR